ncbi:hypothetical protein DN402_07155 [Streptomyces sp. SW4]|nr:hypothetical protein DN402_07155 [Streptomyces sp. SW4]
MRQPFIVGLGRSGAGLHLRALRTAASVSPPPWAGPVIACDPRPDAADGLLPPVTLTHGVAEARAHLDPATTVVHVCTPPATRPAVLAELAAHGFTDLLVEKPLAASPAALEEIHRLRERHGLRIEVVAHWLAAGLTGRLRALRDTGDLGRLLTIDVEQHKPRFLRSLRDDGHPTAFDVEVPHSLGLVLDLAGPAAVTAASLTDLRCGDSVRLHMGSARLELEHTTGVRTRIVSDLGAPVRRRSVTLTFERGRAVAHYPLSDADDHAQLLLTGARTAHEVFRDDALTAFVRQAYARFDQGDAGAGFALHAEVVRLLCAAKDRCATPGGGATDAA